MRTKLLILFISLFCLNTQAFDLPFSYMRMKWKKVEPANKGVVENIQWEYNQNSKRLSIRFEVLKPRPQEARRTEHIIYDASRKGSLSAAKRVLGSRKAMLKSFQSFLGKNHPPGSINLEAVLDAYESLPRRNLPARLIFFWDGRITSGSLDPVLLNEYARHLRFQGASLYFVDEFENSAVEFMQELARNGGGNYYSRGEVKTFPPGLVALRCQWSHAKESWYWVDSAFLGFQAETPRGTLICQYYDHEKQRMHSQSFFLH